jgi:hypothetical protein
MLFRLDPSLVDWYARVRRAMSRLQAWAAHAGNERSALTIIAARPYLRGYYERVSDDTYLTVLEY